MILVVIDGNGADNADDDNVGHSLEADNFNSILIFYLESYFSPC